MKSLPRFGMIAAAVAVALSAQAQQNTVVAVKEATAPVLDGDASDALWSKAKPITVKLANGRNFDGGKTTATIKAAYTADTLYMLVVYDDPTLSQRRGPYQKQADGKWMKLKDPADKGGDNNLYYEDKWAMIWNINGSIKDFAKDGCFAMCHDDEPPRPYGNKYTETAGEIGDIWHAKGVRGAFTIGQIDDQWLDHTRYDKEKAEGAGRKSDAKTGGGYENVNLVNGKSEFMNKDGKAAKAANKGGTYWIKAEDKAPFDDSKFVAGDEVAAILISKFTGDRGHISSSGKYAGGKYTRSGSRNSHERGGSGCPEGHPSFHPPSGARQVTLKFCGIAGLTLVTADQATGTIRGTRGSVEGIIAVRHRPDGRVGVEISARDPPDKDDPTLTRRLTDAYDRRMGR